MHVGGTSWDLNWYVRLIVTLLSVVVGLLFAGKKVASKYFEIDANFEGSTSGGSGSDLRSTHEMTEKRLNHPRDEDYPCVNCVNPGTKKCSRCKSVRYCSMRCQTAHWMSGHKSECKDSGKVNSALTACENAGLKTFAVGERRFSGIALVPRMGKLKPIKKLGKVLFPYEEFIELYNSYKPAFAPCGLLNCGNSCFANVVLQCLTYTRPLFAFLLQSGHRRECRRNDWCFLCVFQGHVERASQSSLPFSPMNILSRLPNIGGNLGYGRQEDAHEFMRFAIDTMQSVCLDEFGGETVVDHATQETTIIQHIFGGHLQSQVICAKCNKISNQLENMMDLTVEIHGDAESLEECLDQFTAEEMLHGDNMYKCDGCNDYVKAWKRLTIHRAPNILTIALKRFQSGRFGKLNKRVTFPETLDLSPYMSKEGDGSDVYNLYAVVVHVDMLNASFFGHYICYTKDFHGNWYRIDDCKVANVELEEVLSQGAYMLLYSRVSVRPSCLRDDISLEKQQEQTVEMELDSSSKEIMIESSSSALEPADALSTSVSVVSVKEQEQPVEMELDSPSKEIMIESSSSALEPADALSTSVSVLSENHSEAVINHLENVVVNLKSPSAASNGVSPHENGSSSSGVESEDNVDAEQRFNHELCSSSAVDDPDSTTAVDSASDSGHSKDSSEAIAVEKCSINGDLTKDAMLKDDVKVNGSAHSYNGELFISSKAHNLKRESPTAVCDLNGINGHEAKKLEIGTSNNDS